MTVLLPPLSPSRATPYTALALTGLDAMYPGHVKRQLFGSGARFKPAGGGAVASDELSYGKFVESTTCRRIAGRSRAPAPKAQLAAMARRPEGVFPAQENREPLAFFTGLRGFMTRYEGLEAKELVKHMNHVLTQIMGVIDRYLWTSEQPWAGAARFSALRVGGMACANRVGRPIGHTIQFLVQRRSMEMDGVMNSALRVAPGAVQRAGSGNVGALPRIHYQPSNLCNISYRRIFPGATLYGAYHVEAS